ncbi:MAG: O-antigen ligase family protein [Bacteroidota bacterium]
MTNSKIDTHSRTNYIVILSCLLISVFAYWNLAIGLVLSLSFLIAYFLFNKSFSFFPSLKLNWTDLFLSGLFLYECLNFTLSIYPSNSLDYLVKITFYVAFYYCLRICFQNDFTRKWFLLIIGAFFTFIVISGLFSYMIGISKINLNGWEDAAQIKNMLSAFGYLNNEFATIGIATLVFPLFCYQLVPPKKWLRLSCWLGFILVQAAILLTFSRGAYLSLAFFWLVLTSFTIFLQHTPYKRLFSFVGLSLATISVFALLFMTPILSTLSFNSSISQQRSTSGRMSIIQKGLCQAEENLWLGVGGNNYPIINDNCKEGALTAAYTRFTNNTYLQLFIEKGIIGLCFYLAFLLSIVFHFIRGITQVESSHDKAMYAVAFSGFLALGARELFFSTLFYSPPVLVLFAILSTLLVFPAKKETIKFERFFILKIGLLSAVSTFLLYKHVQYSSIISRIEQNRFNPPVSTDIAPYFHAKALKNGQTDASIEELIKGTVPLATEKMRQAKADLEKALALNPFDAGYYFNISWINYWLKEEQELVLGAMEECLKLDGGITAYQVGAGLMKLSMEDTMAANSHFQLALNLSPQLVDSEFWLWLKKSQVEITTQMIVNAIKKFRAELQTGYDPIIASKLAKLLLYQSKIAESKLLLEEVIEKLPNLNRPYYNLVIIAGYEGSNRQASRLLNQSIFLDQNDYLAPLLKANLLDTQIKTQSGAVVEASYQYENALYNYLQNSTIHYNKSLSKYQYFEGPINDLILKELHAFCRPSFPVKKICLRLAELFKQMGEVELSEKYNNLAKKGAELTYKDLDLLNSQ